jgi:hypothetical protein
MDVDQAANIIMERRSRTSSKASISPPTAACGSMGSGWQPGHPSTGGPGTAGCRVGPIEELTSPPRRTRWVAAPAMVANVERKLFAVNLAGQLMYCRSRSTDQPRRAGRKAPITQTEKHTGSHCFFAYLAKSAFNPLVPLTMFLCKKWETGDAKRHCGHICDSPVGMRAASVRSIWTIVSIRGCERWQRGLHDRQPQSNSTLHSRIHLPRKCTRQRLHILLRRNGVPQLRI